MPVRLPVRLIESLAEIAAGYDALYCDLWGCYHNGLAPYRAATEALRRYRAAGGIVVLMTNAPRPAAAVAQHLAGMGAPSDTWDLIVSSGDAAQAEAASGRFGRRVVHVGPDRDLGFFEGLELILTDVSDAEGVICTGLTDDEVETPQDYAPAIAQWRARRLPMLCANPDVIVDRGDRRLYCAGAIGEAYAAAGGVVVLTGKPHASIYRLAEAKLRARRGGAPARVLAIGDGIATDIAGGVAMGIDTLFITGGIAAGQISDDPDRLAAFVAQAGVVPTYAMGRLR